MAIVWMNRKFAWDSGLSELIMPKVTWEPSSNPQQWVDILVGEVCSRSYITLVSNLSFDFYSHWLLVSHEYRVNVALFCFLPCPPQGNVIISWETIKGSIRTCRSLLGFWKHLNYFIMDSSRLNSRKNKGLKNFVSKNNFSWTSLVGKSASFF